MTPDEYVAVILRKYETPVGINSPSVAVANELIPTLKTWAGAWFDSINYSGSFAKGTAIKGGSDIDLFISLKSATPDSLRNLYNSLFELSQQKGWQPRRQTVSVGLRYKGFAIDLVPGKIQSGYKNYHSIYRTKTDSWTQTNVSLHVDKVSKSGRLQEIRAVKIWRNLHYIDFHSFYLELTVMNALSNRRTDTLADNVWTALKYIAERLPTDVIKDPANTNNNVSDDLTIREKQVIASQALTTLGASDWNQIIW
jgi:tRNA nucleotidyltransferase (CCA-adding enzyme)